MTKDREKAPAGTRRGLLRLGAATAGAVLTDGARAASQAAATIAGPSLALTAQATEGPFYFDPKLMRADISEGLPGVPMELRFEVLDTQGAACAGLGVDVWHCDARGVYSGYAGQGSGRSVSTVGQTFLRGSLLTSNNGVAAFRTIYPGWYRGRTTHIHMKVFNGPRRVLTSQLFLPDALSEFLYTQLPAYRRRQLRDTLNSSDGIALEAGPTTLGSVRQESDRYVAALRLVVDRDAHPRVDRPPMVGAGPDGRRGPPPGAGFGPPPGGPGGPPPARELSPQQRLLALIPGGGTASP